MKTGSYFISFTYPLDEVAGFIILHEVRKEMSWYVNFLFIFSIFIYLFYLIGEWLMSLFKRKLNKKGKNLLK